MIRLSVDDGGAGDVRIADLCAQYEIECVFYWPVEWTGLAFNNGYTPLTFSNALDIADNFEIGSHGITHRHLTKLPLAEAVYEIADSKHMLEHLFDKQIDKFAPSRGYTNPELTEFTLGIYDSQRLTKGKGLVHVHPHSGANNEMDWREYYNSIKDDCEDIEIWGHSHEFSRYDLWDQLEEFLEIATQRRYV